MDLIFFDPPYRFLTEKPEVLTRVAKQMAMRHLRTDGTLVFRHDAGDVLALPGLRVIEQRVYGSMAIELLRPDRDASGIDSAAADEETR